MALMQCNPYPFRFAKEKRLRLWKDYAPTTNAIDVKDREFTGKVLGIAIFFPSFCLSIYSSIHLPFIIILQHFYLTQVMEVVNADAMVVRHPSGKDMKIHLSSLRPPRLQAKEEEVCLPENNLFLLILKVNYFPTLFLRK